MTKWTVYDPQGAVRARGDVKAEVLATVAPRKPGAKGRNEGWVALRYQGWRLVYTPRPRRSRTEFRDTVRAGKAERVARILEAAIAEALEVGYQWITREAVAKRAGLSDASVSNAFGGLVALKRRVMAEAVERPIPVIVAQGLADGSSIAAAAPFAVKEAARATLGG